MDFGIQSWCSLAQLFYLKIGIKIVPTHTGLLKELNEVRCIKKLTQCFAHCICAINKSQPLSTGSDCVRRRGHVAIAEDIFGCHD